MAHNNAMFGICLKQASPVAMLLVLVDCSNYPRDVSGTFETVALSRSIRVGVISGLRDEDRPKVAAFLKSLERASGARATIRSAAAEPLIAELQAGQLDLAIGEVAARSPWVKDVAVIEPLDERRVGHSTVGLSPIARNGENKWILLLEHTAREESKAK